MKLREHEIRCFCKSHPLLATYGRREAVLFVHVKIWKGNRVFGELYIEGGLVKIRCRNCKRWHNIAIRNGEAELQPSPEPPVRTVDV